ncbi:hypothetical protein M9H77_30864 [Catharanthus roseus]|uniref:Uncharacterized protein n=1 Tax=Catharanthus roseus TaxID=4058 RepID=A0ACB9ZZR6_CATRO|nr:hypothetical protein M9H77_30864 [Catharanthus roseus]
MNLEFLPLISSEWSNFNSIGGVFSLGTWYDSPKPSLRITCSQINSLLEGTLNAWFWRNLKNKEHLQEKNNERKQLTSLYLRENQQDYGKSHLFSNSKEGPKTQATPTMELAPQEDIRIWKLD